MGSWLSFHHARHIFHERAGHQQEIEEHKEEENGARPRRDQTVRNGGKAMAFITHRQHNGRAVALTQPMNATPPMSQIMAGNQPHNVVATMAPTIGPAAAMDLK